MIPLSASVERLDRETPEHQISADSDIGPLRVAFEHAVAAEAMVAARRSHRQIDQLFAADDLRVDLSIGQGLIEGLKLAVGIAKHDDAATGGAIRNLARRSIDDVLLVSTRN